MIAMTHDPQIETYLARLNRALAGVAPAYRDDIVLEIRSHLYDSLASTTGSDPAGAVLRGLGDPAELAERYRAEFLLARAARSYSPSMLLQAAWRWAMTSVKGVGVFFIGLFGYGTALAMTISILLKPFLPNEIGLWVGPGTIEIGTANKGAAVHEVLGRSYIPVMTIVAFVVAVATTQILRWVMREHAPSSSRP